MSIREKVESLPVRREPSGIDWLVRSDVLAILGEEKFTRDDTWPELPLTGGGSYESPNERKGQRRVKLGRRGRDSGVRRLGVERRGEG